MSDQTTFEGCNEIKIYVCNNQMHCVNVIEVNVLTYPIPRVS